MIITIENLTKEYTTPSGEKRKVLNNLQLFVNKGDSIAIVGPSGSGKSTLLNIIGLLDTPTAGKLLIDNMDVLQMAEKEQTQMRNTRLGFVFQLHHLLQQCTILENVLLPTLPYLDKSKKIEWKQRAEKLLERVGLEKQKHQFPSQISGGESQRAAFVRALINSPDILLADEPTGSLDAKSATETGNIITEFNKELQLTVIVVTHSMELAKKMNTIYHLVDGTLIKQ